MTQPRASLLTIGAELLKGTVLNTNARFLGRELTALGFEVIEQNACPDAVPDMLHAFQRIFAQSDLVVLSGGLGPTPDDLTRDAIAAFFHVPLIFSRRQFAFIERYYRQRKKKVPALVKKEAMFPANAVPLFNPYGIALGFYIPVAGKLLVALPGVPGELENMFSRLVIPVIRRHFKKIPRYFPVIAKTVGLSEPEVMLRLRRDFFKDSFEFGIYPEPGEVTLRLYAGQKKVADRLKRKIRERLGQALYAFGEKSLAETVGAHLLRRKKTVAIAESCTGGACAAEIAKIPGASRYFRGGVVAYHADVKRSLGVSSYALRHGEVSPQTAAELARGARIYLGADYGVGITGIAGPSGGNAKKPAGLVYISISHARKTLVFKHVFWGNRGQVQTKAVKKALEHLFHRANRPL